MRKLAELNDNQRQAVIGELRELITKRADLLRQLQAAYVSYSRALGELEFELRKIESISARFATFLDSNLLWIPNLDRLTFGALGHLWVAPSRFLGAPVWRSSFHALSQDIAQTPGTVFASRACIHRLLFDSPTAPRPNIADERTSRASAHGSLS